MFEQNFVFVESIEAGGTCTETEDSERCYCGAIAGMAEWRHCEGGSAGCGGGGENMKRTFLFRRDITSGKHFCRTGWAPMLNRDPQFSAETFIWWGHLEPGYSEVTLKVYNTDKYVRVTKIERIGDALQSILKIKKIDGV